VPSWFWGKKRKKRGDDSIPVKTWRDKRGGGEGPAKLYGRKGENIVLLQKKKEV